MNSKFALVLAISSVACAAPEGKASSGQHEARSTDAGRDGARATGMGYAQLSNSGQESIVAVWDTGYRVSLPSGFSGRMAVPAGAHEVTFYDGSGMILRTDTVVGH